MSSPSKASSSTALVADCSYKKRGFGTLTLTKSQPQRLSWDPAGAPNSEQSLSFDGRKINSLFASPAGSPKVILRVGVLGQPGQEEEFFNFTFTTASSAISDREHFKRDLSAMIARYREERATAASVASPIDLDGAVGTPDAAAGSPAVNGVSKGKGRAVDPSATSEVKKRVLAKMPELHTLYKELVRGSGGRPGVISDADFWLGREHLLQAEAHESAQEKGRSAQLVEPRPETTESGDTKISITPQLIRDIFEQYPIVQKAYSETVPQRLQEGQFWQRYFQSKLFNRHRASARDAGDSIKDDAIFDQYLKSYDDDLEPRDVDTSDLSRTLDLFATEADHGETGNANDYTMRAGANRNALPLIRRFNERSERLLDSSLGPQAKRQRIDGGDAGSRNYYDEITLDDLEDTRSDDRIILDMQDQQRYFQGRAEEDDADETDAEDNERIVEETRARFSDWQPDLGHFRVSRKVSSAATNSILDALRLRQAGREGASFPKDVLAAMTASQAATNEFLRQFWAAVLPPKVDDISANAMATPKERFEKATRLKGYLEKTKARVDAVVASVPAEDAERVQEAFRPLVDAADWAVQWYVANAPVPKRKA